MRTTIIRTFNGTKAIAKVVDVEKETVEQREFTSPVAIEDIAKLLKFIKKAYETDTLKILSIVSTESFMNTFDDIMDNMEGEIEPWGVKVLRKPSKNYTGKYFLTCAIV